MKVCTYDRERHREAMHRLWREIRWVTKDEHESAVDAYLSEGRVLIGEIDGEVESLACSVPGTIRHLGQDLPFSAVTGVGTSPVARRRGVASRVTAQLVAADTLDGALVSGLGIFDQGFYNRLGFGAGPCEHWVGFDPATLRVTARARPPKRISKEDWELVHNAMLGRSRSHGSCNLTPAGVTRGDMTRTSGGFGLGYLDDEAHELTHFIWYSAGDGENGPWRVTKLAWRRPEQFLELMALLRDLADQVHLVKMCEPPGIQFQDLLDRPFRQRSVTEKSRFHNTNEAWACWQVRICNLPGCLSQTRLVGPNCAFNLTVTDPIAVHLPADHPWRGVAGKYVVRLGATSGAERGQDPALPTLTASVNAFTRLWLGVRPATGLAVTDDRDGPPELLADLDKTLCLPQPRLGWDF